MADSPPVEESPAQRQARIRREKREKKILAGGNERLAKISNISGRTPDPTPTPVPDPSEPDIRTASYPTPSPLPTNDNSTASTSTSTSTPNDGVGPTEADLRAFLRSAALDPSTQPGADGQEPDLMNMLQQLMAGGAQGSPGLGGEGGGGGGGGGGGAGTPGQPEIPGLPPALAAMLSGAPGGAPAPTQSGASSAYLWKIVHAVSAFLLAGYYVLWAPYAFAGTLAPAGGRRSVDPTIMSAPREDMAGVATAQGANALFYSFVTLQIVLQSSRLLLARSAEEEGMLAKVAGFLPPPWGDRVRLVGRYSSIWTTLVGDAMCVVFVLGCVAWWSGVGA